MPSRALKHLLKHLLNRLQRLLLPLLLLLPSLLQRALEEKGDQWAVVHLTDAEVQQRLWLRSDLRAPRESPWSLLTLRLWLRQDTRPPPLSWLSSVPVGRSTSHAPPSRL